MAGRLASILDVQDGSTVVPFREERIVTILGTLESDGRVSVARLSEGLRVSQVTIRADLRELEDQGLLVRTHGGGLAPAVVGPEKEFAVRERRQFEEKRRIAVAAAELVRDGDVIALDASTSALAVARRVADRKDLTVITNGLRIAMEFVSSSTVTVIMCGGILRRESVSLQGDVGREVFKRYNITTALLGTRGLSLEAGLTDVSPGEVETKQLMVKSADIVVGLADHTKWGRAALASFAQWNEVNRIITDMEAPESMTLELETRGVAVTRV